MFWQLIAALAVLALFPHKVLFVVRVSYVMYLYPLYSIIIRIWTVDDPQSLWTEHSTWFIGIILNKLPGSVPVLRGRSVLLVGNHRNFCDFVIHDIVTEHTANFLSRAMVALVYPFMALISVYTDGVWYFVRGGGRNLDEFFQWIDSKFQRHKTGRTHLLVYPEGHRNLKKQHLPLRSGMIRYAYSRKIPIQIFMTSGYDNVVNEKRFRSEWGETSVNYKVYDPIFTDQYLNFESLMDDLKKSFGEFFNELHNPVTTAG